MSSKPTTPTIRRLSDLKPGERGTFFAVLAERTRDGHAARTNLTTRAGSSDLRRTATYMVWADGPYFTGCEAEWQAGQFFKIQAVYGEHDKYGPQIDVEKIRLVEDRDKADGFDPADFVERSRFGPGDSMLRELRELRPMQTIADEPLRRLTAGLLDRHARPAEATAGQREAFLPIRRRSGWNTLCPWLAWPCWLADHYRDPISRTLTPPLNRDLVAAGAVLHDIGRVAELEPRPDSLTRPSRPWTGGLLGHLFLGRDLVRDAAREQGDVNPELLRLLEHLIVTHLNLARVGFAAVAADPRSADPCTTPTTWTPRWRCSPAA